MNVTLNYDKEKLTMDIPEKNILKILVPNEIDSGLVNEDEVEQALDNPLQCLMIEEGFCAEDKVAVVIGATISSAFNKIILPQILCRLALAGVKSENITVVISLARNACHSETEIIELVGGDLFDSYRCVDAGSNGFVPVGVADKELEVEMCKHVVEATKRICIATVEFNALWGYSGGAATLVPGVASAKTVDSLLYLASKGAVYSGILGESPVRRVIDKTISFCQADFILNVVLDEQQRIVKAVAGDCQQAHRAGCDFLDSLYKIAIEEKADIVVVSAGGWPNDVDFAQSQKALLHARQALAPGGTIILLAACKEGVGDGILLPALAEQETFVVSNLSLADAKTLSVKVYDELEFAFDVALAKHGVGAKIIVMPNGSLTLPQMV